MESGKQLPPQSSATYSLQMVSSSASSPPAPPQTKCSPASSLASSSPLTKNGQMPQMTVNEHFNTSGSSNTFPLINHPDLGLYMSSSSHSEFGGLGSLGLSSMAAFSQFGTFPVSHFNTPDWRRTAEAPTRGVFFPPFLGLHPVFASTFKSLDPIHLQAAFSSVSVGVKGTVNGRGPSSPTGKSAVSTSSFPVKEQRGTNTSNGSGSQKPRQDPGQLHQKTVQQTKEKKPNKRSSEILNMGGSHSGSVSGSSSDGEETSSDPDDMEEEDNDEDEDNQSNDSEDSDLEKDGRVKVKVKRLTQNTSESKKRPSTAVDSHCDSVPLTSLYNLQFSSHRAGGSQSTGLFADSKTAEEKAQQHISVIQTTGLAGGSNALARCHRKSFPLLFKARPNPVSFSTSHKHLPPSSSPKHSSHLSSPKHSYVASSPKPLDLCSPAKSLPPCSSPKPSSLYSSSPPSLSSLPKPPKSIVSQKAPHKNKFPMPTQPVDSMKESSGNLSDESSLKMKTLKLKKLAHSKDSFKQASSARPTSQNRSDTSLFLSHHPNGAIHSTAQDAPLALIAKPHHLSSLSSTKLLLAPSSSYPVPINLSTGKKEPSGTAASPLKPSASLGLTHRSGKTTTLTSLHAGKSHPKNTVSYLVRGCESDMYSNKDSDDSLDDFDDDDDDDGIEDEESGSSLSESESNLESDSVGSEDEIKGHSETQAVSGHCESVASLSPPKSSSNLSTSSPLLNLPIIKPSVSLCTSTTLTSSGSLSNHSSPSPSFATLPGSGKRRRVTDESVLRLPLKFGWQRETRIRTVSGRLQGEVAYFTPCGKKLRQYPDVIKYLVRTGITKISRDNFSFSTKMKVGDFYEAREGPEGLQWVLLAEEEIAASIIAMDGRHHRRPKSDETAAEAFGVRETKDHLKLNIDKSNFQNVRDVKLLRKLEAQEIARQAAQIKLMRKLEKQAMLQAAKEARKQQVIMAAEERRKKREQLKSLKQQEKIKRIQQVRIEKERRAQQILESKRKKKEAAANAKILEAEKRNKEKEIRRLQAVILKHQELERHRLDMERERRRQHMMLMKAVEARKRAEEKERLKKEKKDEKRLNKERKLELRRLELEKVRELKKPNEDMCLADHKPLPELSRIPGLVLSGSTFSDCLMVLQFLCSFGKVLGLDKGSTTINLCDLQVGLLNIGDSRNRVQDLLVSLLSAAVCDPGLPAGHKSKTILGDHLNNVEINRDNASEILQMYMESHCEQTQLDALTLSLRTKPFQAHSPSQKASVLAFLVNELCSSKAVISEIDKNIDHMTNLKKDMWAVEGRLRKLRNIHAKRTGKRDIGVGGEDSRTLVIPAVTNKSKNKEGDSEEEEDEDDDTEDQGDDDDEDEEESGGRKGKKTDVCEEEDDGVHSISVEELEKQIEKTYKQQNHIRQKLYESSVSLRSMTIGQDRYKRRYWLLPQCGGVFVEGVDSGEGCEEVEREKKQQRATQDVGVKEEQYEQKPVGSSPPQSDPATSSHQDSLNLFLQKPGSLSNLSKLLEEAKTSQDSEIDTNSYKNASYPLYPCSQRGLTHSPTSVTYQQVISANKTEASLLRGPPWMSCSPQRGPHHDQLTKTLKEKNSQWFSLLPRFPCDEASVASGSCTSGTEPLSSPNSSATLNNSAPAGINNLSSSVLQQVKSGIHQSSLTLCDVPSTASILSLSLPGTSPHPMLDLVPQPAEGSGNAVRLLANNNAVTKRETTKVASETPLCASFANVEVAKTQDYPTPQPIPEEMLHGWWRISDTEELHSLVKALHSRGIREKVLQKQIQKHMEDMSQLCANSNHVADVTEKQDVSKRSVESWCIEEQAMEVDIGLLQQVEELERKVVSASLQVKGWMRPEPQSQREDLVYHEHKLFSSPAPRHKGCSETSSEEALSVVRWPNNPLDIAVSRLAELERSIERSEEEAAPGLRVWRKAVSEVRSSAQLSLCLQKLQKSISWERSLMKVHCQICGKGDNEELLLLCDGCDKGCHTYCHRPKITTVPEGDWFCPSCVAKESDQFPRSQKQQSPTAGGGKVKRSVAGEHTKEEAASSNGASRKATKEVRKRRGDDVTPSPQAKHDSPVPCSKKAKAARADSNGLATCRVLLAELEAHPDAWPFLTPVNHKAVPGYRKVIKKPMDFSTIREKLANNQYINLETFIVDVNLVFDNCEKFNEDNSEIGRAGHTMRRFFDKRWTELLK